MPATPIAHFGAIGGRLFVVIKRTPKIAIYEKALKIARSAGGVLSSILPDNPESMTLSIFLRWSLLKLSAKKLATQQPQVCKDVDNSIPLQWALVDNANSSIEVNGNTIRIAMALLDNGMGGNTAANGLICTIYINNTLDAPSCVVLPTVFGLSARGFLFGYPAFKPTSMSHPVNVTDAIKATDGRYDKLLMSLFTSTAHVVEDMDGNGVVLFIDGLYKCYSRPYKAPPVMTRKRGRPPKQVEPKRRRVVPSLVSADTNYEPSEADTNYTEWSKVKDALEGEMSKLEQTSMGRAVKIADTLIKWQWINITAGTIYVKGAEGDLKYIATYLPTKVTAIHIVANSKWYIFFAKQF
eukprot:GHVS01023549.1.p1 GENE.GHVS01023549.1~~GHVS01023549.1.p1  ORF type:complete len:353 (-),score=19.48 GHVS01023549.1:150-1208(-)